MWGRTGGVWVDSGMSVGYHLEMCPLVLTVESYNFRKYEKWEVQYRPIGFVWKQLFVTNDSTGLISVTTYLDAAMEKLYCKHSGCWN